MSFSERCSPDNVAAGAQQQQQRQFQSMSTSPANLGSRALLAASTSPREQRERRASLCFPSLVVVGLNRGGSCLLVLIFAGDSCSLRFFETLHSFDVAFARLADWSSVLFHEKQEHRYCRGSHTAPKGLASYLAVHLLLLTSGAPIPCHYCALAQAGCVNINPARFRSESCCCLCCRL